MKLGISSYAYGWAIGFGAVRPPIPMRVMDLLAHAVRLNCQVVQIADNLPPESFSPEQRAEAEQYAARQGLELELGARRLTPERLALMVNLAREMKVQLIRFLIDDGDYHPPLTDIASLLRDALPMLGEVRIAIENHDRFRAVELRRLMEQVASDRVGICLDVANSFGMGECPQAVVRELAPWVINLHLKDVTIRRIDTLMGFLIEGCPVGTGKIDIRWVLDQITARCTSAILESWTPQRGSLAETIQAEADGVDQSYRYLTALWKEKRKHG